MLRHDKQELLDSRSADRSVSSKVSRDVTSSPADPFLVTEITEEYKPLPPQLVFLVFFQILLSYFLDIFRAEVFNYYVRLHLQENNESHFSGRSTTF